MPRFLTKQARFPFLGVLSLLLYWGITTLSHQFNWGEGYMDRPIPTYLFFYFSLFIVYMLAIVWMLKMPDNTPSIWSIFIFGLLFRAALLPSNQIQEDDIYRYLWDGKVFANGINPYKYPPTVISDYKKLTVRDPRSFQARFNVEETKELALLYSLKWKSEKSIVFMERVNHPDVPTIYPPLAQYVFRMVHWIAPDSILTMRLVFLAFDLLGFGFIVLILKTLGKNTAFSLIYFWSPLIIKETFNSTHLDVVGISVLCASLYFLIRKKWLWALVFLALGVMGKLYPLILFPIYIREIVLYRYDGNFFPKTGLNVSAGVIAFFGVITICYLPFYSLGSGVFEGLKTFTTFWQSNESLFAIIVFVYKNLLGLEQSFNLNQEAQWFSYDFPTLFSKLTVAIILLTTVLFFTFFRRSSNTVETIRQAFIIIGLVFLLSPVQNPWYLNWLVPFLCVFPSRAWLLLTGLIGLYYMDFYFNYQEISGYGYWLPWIEYTPFYIFLVFDYWKSRQEAISRI